ncbi:hypothetical protein LOD99_11076 [Oopsacas minuta]|uniref:Uncharacterized protein n=1 Tax=Oopsacas minuta TaxID=111878 RepID=A0AAV7KAV0_9METZ|nr:hypothetical protein LOD99_11076 [Oopsacas minuta]
MATRDSEQPTHSNWDLVDEQTLREDISLPTYSFMQDPYQSSDEILTDDEDDANFCGGPASIEEATPSIPQQFFFPPKEPSPKSTKGNGHR